MYFFKIKLSIFVFVCFLGQVLCQNCPNEDDLFPCRCIESKTDASYTEIQCNYATEDEIEQAFLADFPKKALTKFSMRDNYLLTNLTRNLFNDITFDGIDIGYSTIESVDPSFFDNSYETITYITFIVCRLTDFPFSILPRFPKLNDIALNNNALTTIPSLTSSTLVSFYLNANNIHTIDEFTFVDLTAIREIHLDSNFITDIPISSFLGVNSIEYIGLSSNQIDVLRTGSFSALPNLEQIMLDLNPIREIENAAFIDLPSLNYLSMISTNTTVLQAGFCFACSGDVITFEHSLIETIEANAFADINIAAGSIWFTSSRLTSLVTNTFAGVPAGIILLHENSISVIEPDAFPDFKNSAIYLMNNQLATLDESWLGSILKAGNTVDVQHNPLECGCDMLWIYANSTYLDLLINNPTCSDGEVINSLDGPKNC